MITISVFRGEWESDDFFAKKEEKIRTKKNILMDRTAGSM